MWFYLFGRSERYPDPLAEIGHLAKLDERGEEVFLKLSARDDAPMKNAAPGERVFLCTRDGGHWSLRGEAELIGPAVRGAAPASVISLYGDVGERHWWRRLGNIQIYQVPKSAKHVGVEREALPQVGQAYVIRVAGRRNGAAAGEVDETSQSPLEALTAAMDAAWDHGRATDEAIDSAVRRFRAEHPYGK